jgi:NADH-quinone oxidoreductase subunit G
MVNIEINGIAIEARDGAMLIEAADEAGIRIPRFCYHKKLSVAANCRMCLVEVEKAPKPMPACATPVTEGMKVFTKSEKALAAQRAVMEFLLINHPLDCPICDQGGECELQEMAMGYGQDISRFSERKRVVMDKDIGPLIATDMTRCIHCTRCVRFGQEIAGIRELGATGRGEHMEIGTFIEKSVDSELSGNVIDLCPVGALTSKPFRYSARPWELNDRPAIAPHDCLGSNITIQTRRNTVMRVLPRENESVNEVWLSDRDRYSYEAVNSEQRLTAPMIKVDGAWEETDWNTALEFVVQRTKESGAGGEQIGALVSPNATVEELYLAQKLARGLGSNNIDHRLRQCDFSDQGGAPLFPGLGMSIAELESVDAALLVGSNVRKEQPLAALRLRKAALNGARLMFVNPVDYEFNFPVAVTETGSTAMMVRQLAGITKTLLHLSGQSAPEGLDALLSNIDSNDNQVAIAEHLHAAQCGSVILGNLAQASDRFADLRALAGLIARLSGARIGYLSEGANAAGAWLAGAIPHRHAAGQPLQGGDGLTAGEMLQQPRQVYFLLGIEPELDSAFPAQAQRALRQAGVVVAMSVFDSEALREFADVLLPITPFTETSGTFVSAEGRWQSFAGAVQPRGEARPAWKVLRVLGNFFNLEGFDYLSSEQIRDELQSRCAEVPADTLSPWRCPASLEPPAGIQRIGEVPIYAVDALTRRAEALQATHDARPAAVYVNTATANKVSLQGGGTALVSQDGDKAILPVVIDERVPEGCALIPAAMVETSSLGASFATVELNKNA